MTSKGPWLDMHPIAPKIVLYLTILSNIFEAGIQLINVVLFEAGR